MAEPSIVTLTLNPALDISAAVDVVAPTHKLRCDRPRFEPGGGGINVSRVCDRLGEATEAVVPLGGATGQRIADLLAAEGLTTRTVPIAGETRQSFSVTEAATAHQYRFVLPGPVLDGTEVARCQDAVLAAAADASCLVVSGSMPDGVQPEVIAELVERLPTTKVIVDTSGPALAAALDSGAHLIKPSARELAALVDGSLENEAEVEAAVRALLARSDVEVIVASIGPGGAIAATRSGEAVRVRAPAVQVRSAVGAGDSMVAGLAVGTARGLDLAQAVALGVAAGTAAVITDGTELCRRNDIDRLLPIVNYQPL